MICEAGFSLGFLCVRYYGIILMLGALAGGYLATLEVKRLGKDPEIVWDLLVYLIVGGVIGARIWHILTPPPSSIAQGFTTLYYLTHPLDALAIWKGGLGIPGTILGGLVGLYLYSRGNKVFSFVQWTDIAAPSLALGQAIGRWGNFFNQELYGAPTNLPWKIEIDPAHRLAGFEDQSFYHPLFAYESILSIATMLFLLWLRRRGAKGLKNGDIFNTYLIIYPAVRFGLDFLRLDAAEVLSVNINQAIMAIVCVAAIGVLIWRHRAGQPTAGTSGERPSQTQPPQRATVASQTPKAAPRVRSKATAKSSKTPPRKRRVRRS
jgi:phosphatidylglycerol:prolipoprotein diacylglycerol transferase